MNDKNGVAVLGRQHSEAAIEAMQRVLTEADGHRAELPSRYRRLAIAALDHIAEIEDHAAV